MSGYERRMTRYSQKYNGAKQRDRQMTVGARKKRRTLGARRVTYGAGRAVIPIDMVRSSGLSAAVRNAEFKFNDVTSSFLNNIFINAPAGVLMNGLIVGSTATSRIGRQVIVKSFELRMAVYNQVAGLLGCTFCWDVVLDRQANAQAATIQDIWNSSDPLSPRNISNKKRFKVLATSGLQSMSSTILGDGSDSAWNTYTIYKKVNIPVQYNDGTAGTVGDITSNAMYLFLRTDAPVVALNGLSWRLATRIRYTDY